MRVSVCVYVCVQPVGRLPSCQSILEVGLVSAPQSSVSLLYEPSDAKRVLRASHSKSSKVLQSDV